MKEIKDIILAARVAATENRGMALATVVKVEGSSYRRPGARMLVTDDGQMTGAISGGCLEGDALKKALLAIHQRKNRLVTYDTNAVDESAIGVQLGCNGIIHILFEYIDLRRNDQPIALLEHLLQSRCEAILVTCFSTRRLQEQRGSILLTAVAADGSSTASDPGDPMLSALEGPIRQARSKRQSMLVPLGPQEAAEEALIEYLAPAPHLVIAGAGNDARPVVEAAHLLGWEISVVDGRASHALATRFPKADQVITCPAAAVTTKLSIDPWTVFVLMTHNYAYDLSLLTQLIGTPTPYIGSLGPRTKLTRMLEDMQQAGISLSEAEQKIIHGPVGLDIGAETSEEIAISIVAEINAVLRARAGGPLKFLTTKIHAQTPLII